MSAAEPSDEQLAAYLASNPERFRDRGPADIPSGLSERDAAREHASKATANRSRAPWPAPTRQWTRRRSAIPSCSARSFTAVSQSDVASTFGEGFAKQHIRHGTGPLAGTDPVELRAAFRLYQRTNTGRRAAARCCPGSRPSRVVERAPARGGAEALCARCGSATRSWWRRRRQGRSSRSRPMKCLAYAACCSWCAARRSRRARTNFGRAIWNCARRRPTPTACFSRFPARGEDLRLAIYVKLPEGTHDVAPPRASFSDGAYVERRTIRRDGGLAGQTDRDRRPVGHVDGRAGSDRKPWRRHADRTAFADKDSVRRSGRARRWRSRRDLSAPWRRAHPVRLRSSAVRPGAGDPRSRLAARRRHRDGVHHCAQHHACRGDARFCQRAGSARRGGHRAQHHAGRRRDRECTARKAKPGGALPWLVAFCFGLLHGFGFAGALAEVGLPHHAIPVALLFFNLGVEIGQLVFVAAVLSVIWLLRYEMSRRWDAALVKRTFDNLDVTAAYGIGIVAAYWLIERTTAFSA